MPSCCPARLLAALTAVVVFGSACSSDALNGPAGDPEDAVELAGDDITVEELEARFEGIRTNPQTAEQLENDPDGAVEEQALNQLLSQLIVVRLLEDVAEELGVEVTEDDIAEQREQIVQQAGGEEAFTQQLEQSGLSAEDVDFQLRALALQERSIEQLSEQADVPDEELRAFYEANQQQFGPTAQARHILVETEQQANQVLQRLEGGADFADVAQEVSVDEGSGAQGGDLGTITRGQTVEPFEEAVFNEPIGELVGPVETEFGFHLIEVTDRSEGRSFEEARDEIRPQVAQQQVQERLGELLSEESEEAEIRVNPRFGQWDAETLQVVAEEDLEAPGTQSSEAELLPQESGQPQPQPSQ